MPVLFMTGGHGGIGSAIAAYFRAKGYTVLAPSHEELDLTDVSGLRQWASNFDTDIDSFIHCAAINHPKEIDCLSDADTACAMQVNALSFVTLVQCLLPRFKKGAVSHILAVSSLYGVFGRKGRLPYAASKHALNGIVKTLSIELAPDILVNSLSPGYVATELTCRNNSTDMIARFEKKIPLGRMARPDEIASVAYFLCSSANTYVTGQNIFVDGGYMAAGGQER